MAEYIKILIIYFTRFVTRLLFIFPIKKNKVSFISFGGRFFSCSPKYIYLELQKLYGDKLEYIWFFRNIEDKDIPGINIKKIKFLSLKFFYHLATSKYIICNYSMITRPPLRKNQVFINTWHGGGAYKKVGLTNINKEKKRIDITFNILAKDTTYFVSSSKIFTQIMSESMRIPAESFLEIGLPRNDIFFNDYSDIKTKVYNYFNIDLKTKILLVAPTYRGESGNASENMQINISDVISNLEQKFSSNFICLYRGHYYVNNKSLEGTINASSYPDMQELLCAADILITDYSSTIWDFSLTKKPIFLYTSDLDEYSNTREFYTPIEKWGVPFAKNNDELVTKIQKFDYNKYLQDIKENHSYFGSFDEGTACQQLLSYLKF